MCPTPFGNRNPDALDPSNDPWQSNPVLRELAVSFGGDPWGDTMGAFFGIAAVLYSEGEAIPPAWQYQPGAGSSEVDPECYPDAMILDGLRSGEWTAAQLREAGDVLATEADRLRAEGLDY